MLTKSYAFFLFLSKSYAFSSKMNRWLDKIENYVSDTTWSETVDALEATIERIKDTYAPTHYYMLFTQLRWFDIVQWPSHLPGAKELYERLQDDCEKCEVLFQIVVFE